MSACDAFVLEKTMADSNTCFGRVSNKPLKEYSDEQTATYAAQYVLDRYGKQMTPYRCTRCHLWHLSPTSRQTPSQTCICSDQHGKYKQVYLTEEAARRRAQLIKKERHINLQIYPCPYGRGWHLTSNTEPY